MALADLLGDAGAVGAVGAVGDRVERLELPPAWLVDPVTGFEGPARVVVEDGRVAAVERAPGGTPSLLLLPGFVDLHAHLREPGGEDAETIATGLAAAGHGGFVAVCAMANTDPPADAPGVLRLVRAGADASGSPVRVLPLGATTVGRAGAALAPLGEMADAGAVAFSDDGSPVSDPALLRNALLYAGGLGRPIVEHPEDRALTVDAEAHEGLAATVLGLHGWPVAAEAGAVARSVAVLADAVAAAPADATPRLHLTHLSTAAALEHVRRAKASGLPVTCDVTPHHLGLHDGWLGGDRRWAWEVDGAAWRGGPAEAEPYDTNCRVNPPLRSPADAAAVAAALGDGTADAIATDHAPHTDVDKAVEFGEAANGISGLETALSVVLAAVDAGVLRLSSAVRALTSGPAVVLGDAGSGLVPGIVPGADASLVLVDRATTWTVAPATLLSRGRNTPLLGRTLPGRVLLAVAGGRVGYRDGAPASASERR
jgi:dihydroorotase